MKSNSEFRKAARKSLKGHWAVAALLSLITLCIIDLSTAVDLFAFSTRTIKFTESFNLLYTVLVIFPAVFAMLVVFLRLIRKPNTNIIKAFFAHFATIYGHAVSSMLLLAIICCVFSLAGIVVSVALASIPFSLLDIPTDWTDFTSINSLYGLYSIFHSFNLIIYILLCGFLFILTLIPLLMYLYKICLFPFIIEDNPDIGIRESYHQSKMMMEGNRMRFFLLDLSFIGWYLLSIVTFGIALLWVLPYHQTSRAHFYNELKEEYDKSQYLSLE
ncbi:MAG: DUF975 family protein [Paludibacteraceae bacterium]|nr:DUF975 family protein [Paludibacteraceae bacterium]